MRTTRATAEPKRHLAAAAGRANTRRRITHAHSVFAAEIDASPRLAAQRNRIADAFGPVIQRSNATNLQPAGAAVLQLRSVKQTPPKDPDLVANADGAKAGKPELQNKKNHKKKLTGSAPGSASPVGWIDVLSKAKKVKGNWVRFHCLNEKVGGPGVNKNLVPTTHAVNTGATWSNFESDLKGHYNKNEWIWAKTTVTYDSNYPAGFPKTIKGYGQYYDQSSFFPSWKDISKSGTTLTLSKPQFGGGTKTRTLDEMTAATWSLVTGYGTGTKLVKYLNKLGSDSSDVNEFFKKLYAWNAPQIPKKTEALIDLAIKKKHPYVYLAVDY